MLHNVLIIHMLTIVMHLSHCFIIVGPMGQIYRNANARLTQAYAPGSRRSYYKKFVTFLTFCQLFNIDVNNVSVNDAIAFIEVLAASGLTSVTILTYISAIKAKCIEFNLVSCCRITRSLSW